MDVGGFVGGVGEKLSEGCLQIERTPGLAQLPGFSCQCISIRTAACGGGLVQGDPGG